MLLTRRAFCNLAAGAALSIGATTAASSADDALGATITLVPPEIKLSNILFDAKHICFNENRAIVYFSYEGHGSVGLVDSQGHVLACYVFEGDEETPGVSYPFQNGSFALTYRNEVRLINESGEVTNVATLPDEATVIGLENDSVCYGIADGWMHISFFILMPATSVTYELETESVSAYEEWTSYSGGLGGWSGWESSHERGMGVYAVQRVSYWSFFDYYLAHNEGARLDCGNRATTLNSYFFDDSYYPVNVSVDNMGSSGITAVLATNKGEVKEISNTDFSSRYSGSSALLYTKEGLSFGTTVEDSYHARTEDANYFVWNLETNEISWIPNDYDSRIDWDAVKNAQPPLYDEGRLALPVKGDDGNTYIAMFNETLSPIREPVRGDCDEAAEGYPTSFSVTQGSAYSGFNSGRLIVRHGTSCHDEGALRGQDVTVYDRDGQVVFEVSGQDCYMFGDYHNGLALYVSTNDPDTPTFIDTDGNAVFSGFDTSNAMITYI